LRFEITTTEHVETREHTFQSHRSSKRGEDVTLNATVVMHPIPRLALALLTATAFAHRCIHDTLDLSPHMHVSLQKQRTFHSAATTTREPIRIVLDTTQLSNSSMYCTSVGDQRSNLMGSTQTCTADDVLTAAKRDILTQHILPAALARLSSALWVERSSSITSTFGCSRVPHVSIGTVSAADYVLIVTGAPTTSGVLAFAQACELHTQTGRPILGLANFGPAQLSWSDTGSYNNAETVATAIHEVLHALGFAQSFFSTLTTTTTIRSKPATIVATNNVTAVAKTYFNCTNITGVELEDEGGSGSAGSHWDRRILPEEIMAAAGGLYLSNFTLATMESLGWYTANYTAADVPGIAFGKNAGCGFLNSSCNTTLGGRDSQFCFNSSIIGCTPLRRAVGQCLVRDYTGALPSIWQYFANPAQGGDTFFDGCPVVTGYSDRQCSFFRNLTDTDKFLGNYYGANGRCVLTSSTTSSSGLLKTGLGDVVTTPYRCVDVRCPDGGARVEVRIADMTSWLACPTSGAAGSVTVPTASGYRGIIQCPSAADLCGADPSLITGTPAVTASPGSSTTVNATTTPSFSIATTSTTAIISQTFGTTVTAPPLTTAPPTVRYAFQFQSNLALGQLTTSVIAAIAAEAATVFGVAASRITINTYLIEATATSVVRFTLLLAVSVTAPSESALLARLTNATASSTSRLSLLASPIAATTVVVGSCDSVCSTTGAGSSFRYADNTGCSCSCINKWTGSTCATCLTPYSGTQCSQCATGFVAYPDCVPSANCSQPAAQRPTITQGSDCIRAVGSSANTALSSCLQTYCGCVGGSYAPATQQCFGPTADVCSRFACAGATDRCMLSARFSAWTHAGDLCSNETALLTASAVMMQRWCVFDACLETSLSTCSTTMIDAGCDRTSTLSSISAASSLSSRTAAMLTVLVAVAAAVLPTL
jgi:leishmanolysin